MPVDVYWGDEAQSILITEYRGGWTEAEFCQAVDQGVRLAATSAAPRLDNINNLLGSELPLYTRNLFRLTGYARPRLPDHLGALVMVTRFASSDLALAAQALALGRERGFVRHARSLDEARALIMRLREAEAPDKR